MKPYGAFMRAEPRRRSHTMGSKWLRSGGKIPASNTGDSSGTGGREVVTVIGADSGYQGTKIGGDEKGDMMGENQGRREINGLTDNSNLKIITKITDQTDVISEQAGDNNGPELNEIFVLDPKRRRMDQVNESTKKDHEQDVEMLNHEDINQNQKNGLLAGTAMQARLSL